MSVGSFRHMSDIYVPDHLEKKLMRTVARCGELPSSSHTLDLRIVTTDISAFVLPMQEGFYPGVDEISAKCL
jgi:hypothetical protein